MNKPKWQYFQEAFAGLFGGSWSAPEGVNHFDKII